FEAVAKVSYSKCVPDCYRILFGQNDSASSRSRMVRASMTAQASGQSILAGTESPSEFQVATGPFTGPFRKKLMSNRPRTWGELKQAGYRPVSVKQEMRRNLIRKLKAGETLFPGVLGYDQTVIPQIINGILAQHDMLFLGLRG